MTPITQTFATLSARGEKALVPFVTAGDPALDQLPSILEALSQSGADVLEIGIPFSDPIADGPTIQASSQRALDRGVTPAAVLEALSSARVESALVLMGYYNPMLRMGLDAFARSARAAGASGVIVSDLTPEEAGPWKESCATHGLDTVFLAAPTSTEVRLSAVCEQTTGFVYAVSRTGVTGARNELPSEALDLVRRIKARSPLPVCLGFGIAGPEQVRAACEVADGAVVGSWLVELLAKEWRGGEGREIVSEAIAALKAATRPFRR